MPYSVYFKKLRKFAQLLDKRDEKLHCGHIVVIKKLKHKFFVSCSSILFSLLKVASKHPATLASGWGTDILDYLGKISILPEGSVFVV